MSKFKIGDRVVLKKNIKNIDTCGISRGTVLKEQNKINAVSGVFNTSNYEWINLKNSSLDWNSNLFELVSNNQSIHITVKDQTTHAILKQGNQVIKRAKAIRNPSDEFNFEIGANIAFQRLIGNEVEQEVREVKRQAEVGEQIKIVNAYATRGKYSNGDILQVRESICGKLGTFDHVTVTSEEFPTILTSEYVVLENYHPQQEPFDITRVSDEDLLIEVRRRMELR